MFCFVTSLCVVQVTEVSEEKYALNKCTGDPVGALGGPTTRSRASRGVPRDDNLLDWLFKKLEVRMIDIFMLNTT
jgi:hypothetical protein